MKKIAIYGAGGFGREVYCLIMKLNEQILTWDVIGFFDDGKEKGEMVGSYGQILGGIKEVNEWKEELAIVIAVGNTKNISHISQCIDNKFITFPNIIHPDVVFADSKSMKMGMGNIIQRASAFSCDVRIGDFNVFNGGTVLGHDVILGSYNVLMPAVRISGGTIIGNSNFFGIASIVLQGKTVGNNISLGAGSVLMKKPKDGKTYIGNPAKLMEF